MPPKIGKNKKVLNASVGSNENKTSGGSSNEQTEKQKLIKEKPLSKKDRKILEKMEKAMREKTEILRKEADAMEEELKATEEASLKEIAREMDEHKTRIEQLSVICGHFKTAKARLKHENNKFREAEIWERYISEDGAPYPESAPNMHTHLYAWRKKKSTEYMEFALGECDLWIRTLRLLDELIHHPIYASETTVANWKEIRSELRKELLTKIDKACFNKIKNLEANFERDPEKPHIMSFDGGTKQLKLGMSVWIARDASAVVRSPPKIRFELMNVDVEMPVDFKKKEFILRVMFVEMDPLSDTSMTYNIPECIPLECDMLTEATRCFQAKLSANEAVADREREKVRLARMKVQEAKESAEAAERSLKEFQTNMRTKTTKTKSMKPAQVDFEKNEAAEEEPSEGRPLTPKKKKGGGQLTIADAIPHETLNSNRKGRFLEQSQLSPVASILSGEISQKSVDAMSIRSGMRRKPPQKKSLLGPAEGSELRDIFDARSMVSGYSSNRVLIQRDSELCFEERESMSRSDNEELENDNNSVDSLELLLGSDEDEANLECKSIKTLVRNTPLIIRNPPGRSSKQKSLTKKESEIHSYKTQKRDNKSVGSMPSKKVEDEILPTSTEIYDANEDLRQEKYMCSMVLFDIPNMSHHVNLRAYYTVGGCYFIDLIQHESQPRVLQNGCSVQIFYGEMNIKRCAYEYDYSPPLAPQSDDDSNAVKDEGIQHLFKVSVSLPQNVVFFEPPIVGAWDEGRKFWTRQHIHNQAINIESGNASFNLGRPWPFAFFVRKYAHFPFLSWNMTPADNKVRMTISCPQISCEFTVQGKLACLSNAVGVLISIKSHVEEILGEYMPLDQLIEKMKAKGLNVFPDVDAFSYIAQCAAKDVVLEDHTYLSMAMESDKLEYRYCDWNLTCKRRKVAFCVREHLPGYNVNLHYKTVMATSLASTVYACNTDDSFLDETKQLRMGFCPDTCSLLRKAFLQRENPLTRDEAVQCLTVYDLLSRTKVLSYTGVLQTQTPSSSTSTSSRKLARRRRKSRGSKRRRKSILKRNPIPSSASSVLSNK